MRYPAQYLIVVQENRVKQFMSWYTAQSRNRWKTLLQPDDMEASLYANPLVDIGTTEPVTNYYTVWPVRKDQDVSMQINPPAFATLYHVNLNGELTVTEQLLALGLTPQPREEP